VTDNTGVVLCQANSSLPGIAPAYGSFNLAGERRVIGMATKTVKHVRDTRTGRYVEKEEAKRRPATTVTETDKIKTKKK